MKNNKIEIKVKNSNLSFVGKDLSPYGSLSIEFDCVDCGFKNDSLLIYKGKLKTEEHHCGNCNKEYNIAINPYINFS